MKSLINLFNVLVAGLATLLIMVILLTVMIGSSFGQTVVSPKYKQVTVLSDYQKSTIIYTTDSIAIVTTKDYVAAPYSNTYSIAEVTLDTFLANKQSSDYFCSNGKFYYRTKSSNNNLASK